MVSNMAERRRERSTDGLLVTLCMSGVLLALSFVRIVGDAGSAVFGNRVIDATLAQPIWGTRLGLRIALFVVAVAFVHVLLALASWALGRATRIAFPRSANSQRAWSCAWFLLIAAWTLVANAAWFPQSSLGEPYAGMAQASVAGISVIDTATVAVCALLAVVIGRAALALRQRVERGPFLGIGCGVAAVVASVGLISSNGTGAPAPHTDPAKPHVILIGIDSLRTDFVRAGDGNERTPALDEFLAGATVFEDTITPLARTFPSWVSIITGRHPHTTGAIINLFPRDLINEGETLPEILRGAGYKTVYAIDEVRFSNLDASYGFDETITPPMGSADFLLGFFADAPLANVLVNTHVGKWLFPFAHANRAADVTYDPDTFVERLDRELEFDGPTFAAVHFTLVHWPYTWARTPAGVNRDDVPALYGRAVERVDRQFRDLMAVLERKGALGNAIVVVLSDHGESLGEPAVSILDDRLAYGHGTNVLAMSQYQVLFAMRSYETALLPTPPGRAVTAPASLEDIAPTLVDALGLQSPVRFDGRTLIPDLRGEPVSEAAERRVRFLETEFDPPGFRPGELRSASMLSSAARYYRVDPDTDRVHVREQAVDEILVNREYAALRDGHVLASLPAYDAEMQHLVYLAPGAVEPVWLAARPESASGEVGALWSALRGRFDAVDARPVVPRPALPGLVWQQPSVDPVLPDPVAQRAEANAE